MGVFARSIDTYMTYADWDRTRRNIEASRAQAAREERFKRKMYFRRQRAVGAIVFSLGSLVVTAAHYLDIAPLLYLGFAAGLLGLYMIVAKHMILVDEYYLDCQSKLDQ